MNYGYIFSSELQKMAWGLGSIGNAANQANRSLRQNVTGSQSMADYISSNPEAKQMASWGSTPSGGVKKPKAFRNMALEGEIAQWKGVPNTQFNPPKAPDITTRAPQQQDQSQFREQRMPAGAGPGGRFASPVR